MWSLVLIYSIVVGDYKSAHATSNIHHIDGFASQQACINAANKIQRVNAKIEGGIHMFCVSKR